MSASSLTFDPTHLAMREIQSTERKDRFASLAVSMVKAFASVVPPFARGWLGQRLIDRLDKAAQTHAKEALFFKGAAVDLQMDLARGETAHGDELIRAIDSFTPLIVEAMNQCRSAEQVFRNMNGESRVAAAFVRLARTLDSVRESVVLLRVVATGGSLPGVLFAYEGAATWETAVAHQHEEFNRVRESIRNGDTSDIEPELLHLAEQAIATAKERSITDDPDWARRLTDRTFN